MTVRFVHLCPPVEVDRDLFEDDKAAAERDRDKRYEQAVDDLGKELRSKGTQCWVPAHKGFVKVDLVSRKDDVESALTAGVQGFAGYELALVQVEDHDADVRVRIEQDPFGSSIIEVLVPKEPARRAEAKWSGTLLPDQPLEALPGAPEGLGDIAEMAAEHCSVGHLSDLVLPWSLTAEQRKMVVARDEFAQSALSGGRFLVVASYSGQPLRPVDNRGEPVGETKVPGFIKFIASRAALISGSADGRVSIQTRKVAVRDDSTVGQVPDGRLWTGRVDERSLPDRFRAAAKAAVKAAACMPEKGKQVNWEQAKPKARDVATGEDIPCEMVTAPEAKPEPQGETKAAPVAQSSPVPPPTLKDLI
jgi:hypothetical protein